MDLAETIATIIEKGMTAQVEARAQKWRSTPVKHAEEEILSLYSLFYDAVGAFKERVRKDEPMAEYVEFAEEVARSFEGVEGSGALDRKVAGLERDYDKELRSIARGYQNLRMAYDIIEFQAAYFVFSNHPELGDFSSLDAGKRAEIFKGYMASAGYSFKNTRENSRKLLMESKEFSALREERM